MKIWVFALCRNEAPIIPFWLRHYMLFADRILVFDDASDDGSRELLQACPKLSLYDWPFKGGIDEDVFLKFAQDTYVLAVGSADWVMWVDMDEFLFHPDMIALLAEMKGHAVDVVRTQGFNMTGDGLPKDDGRQIWEILRCGVPAPVYSKPVVFRPEAEVRWNRGKHALENCSAKLSIDAPILLLHYRYLGGIYTAMKNKRNYDRCGLLGGDKGAAWSCAPTWKGEHSPEWAESIKGCTSKK